MNAEAVIAAGEISSHGWNMWGLVFGAAVGIIGTILLFAYGEHLKEEERAREAAKKQHPAGKRRKVGDWGNGSKGKRVKKEGFARGGPIPSPSPSPSPSHRYDVEGWIEVPKDVQVPPEANETAPVAPSLRLVDTDDTDPTTLRLVDTEGPESPEDPSGPSGPSGGLKG